MPRKPVIIAYDIVSNRRRRRVHRCLSSWRLDGQYSVFECRLDPQEAKELFLQLARLIDTDSDRLLLAWLDGRREARMLVGPGAIGFARPGWYLG